MAVYTPLYIDQAADFYTTLQVTNEDGSIRNLSNANVYASLRILPYYGDIHTFDIDIFNPEEGEIILKMPYYKTANIKSGRYLYDVLNIDSECRERLVEGIVTVYPAITIVNND